MINRIPRRFRLGLTRAGPLPETNEELASPDGREEVAFVAYGEDCVLVGRTVLDGDRLTDMLNAHDEYALLGVTVERFDGGPPIAVDEVVVGRDEVLLVHGPNPRGHRGRRQKTVPQHIAMQIGPYKVRGFYHALPGTDPDVSIRRRKTMVPLTNARIQYTIGGQSRETRVDTVIINREQIDWLEAVEPDRAEFPAGPRRLLTDPR